MSRPLTAPGSIPVEKEGGRDLPLNNEDSIPTETQLLFAEIEERAKEAQPDNRGHKLTLEELPCFRGRLVPPPVLETPDEEDFSEIERSFVAWQHYHARNAELSPMEVRLLHTYWGRFEEEEELCVALAGPARLADAAANSTVRNGLAGLTLNSIAETLMKTIERCHNENIVACQFVDYLNGLISGLDDGERVPDKKEEEVILQTLALATLYTDSIEKYNKEIADARHLLLEAIKYGHLLGRFLTRRLRKYHSKSSNNII